MNEYWFFYVATAGTSGAWKLNFNSGLAKMKFPQSFSFPLLTKLICNQKEAPQQSKHHSISFFTGKHGKAINASTVF